MARHLNILKCYNHFSQTHHNMNSNAAYPVASSSFMLCSPALTYLVISLIALAVSGVQNARNTNTYAVGHLSYPVQSTVYVFILKMIWFLFWTWLLNVICNKGYKTVAWVLVAIPFLVFFTIIFGLANVALHGGASNASSAGYTVGVSSPSRQQQQQQRPVTTGTNPGEYVYQSGNNADKIGFFPNEAGTQYSSYASYDANLDNRAKFLDRESKGLIQQQPQ
jgi:hypothetical protein